MLTNAKCVIVLLKRRHYAISIVCINVKTIARSDIASVHLVKPQTVLAAISPLGDNVV